MLKLVKNSWFCANNLVKYNYSPLKSYINIGTDYLFKTLTYFYFQQVYTLNTIQL